MLNVLAWVSIDVFQSLKCTFPAQCHAKFTPINQPISSISAKASSLRLAHGIVQWSVSKNLFKYDSQILYILMIYNLDISQTLQFLYI